MAYRKRSTENTEAGGNFTYINHTLTTAQKAQAKTLFAEIETDEILAAIGEIVTEDVQFSLSHNSEDGIYTATFTSFQRGHANYKYKIAYRSTTLEKALFGLLYRHVYVHEGDWTSALSKSGVHADDF